MGQNLLYSHMSVLKIYTDGACSGNPGPGGWGVVLLYGETIKELSGFVPNTTNNRMELLAVIEGLKAVKRPCAIEIYSDSSYVVNAVNKGWIENWKRTNWKNGKIKNQDLFSEIIELNKTLNPRYFWVKGHADNKWNNRCDELAVSEIAKNK